MFFSIICSDLQDESPFRIIGENVEGQWEVAIDYRAINFLYSEVCPSISRWLIDTAEEYG